ncbi:MAG TPA: hypothetical protein PLY86_04585 [bacterium]|nr:hypothetical protein [bacterium]
MKPFVLFMTTILLPICLMQSQALDFTPTASISGPLMDEFSGVIPATQAGEYWGLNDDDPWICRFNSEGQILQTVTFVGLENHDWEAMTSDSQGNLYIGAIGNNAYQENKDYQILILPVPASGVTQVQDFQVRSFRFPDGKLYDCNGLFFLNGELYTITKPPFASSKFLSQWPKIFRIPLIASGETALAEEIGLLCTPGRPTDAAYSPAQQMLAVLSYHGLSLYTVTQVSDLINPPFHNTFGQFGTCESVCFDGDEILLGNEERLLWKHPIAWFQERNKVMPVFGPKYLKLAAEDPSIGDLDQEWTDATTFTLISDSDQPSRDVQVVLTRYGLYLAFEFANVEERYAEGPSWSLGDNRGADNLTIMISPDVEEYMPSEKTRVFDAHFYRNESGEVWPYVQLRSEIELTDEHYATYGPHVFTLTQFNPFVGGAVVYFRETPPRSIWQAMIAGEMLPQEIFSPGASFRFNLTLCEGGYFGNRWFWTGDFFSWDTPYAWGLVHVEESSEVQEYMFY